MTSQHRERKSEREGEREWSFLERDIFEETFSKRHFQRDITMQRQKWWGVIPKGHFRRDPI